MTMKKFTFALMALLAFSFSLKAQQYVSTEPSNRNVVIEEFTGRNCGYCPIGHRITHELMEANPGRVFAINVHCTSLSPTSFPNLNIPKGHSIANGFSFDGIPMGMINRHSGTAAETSQFVSLTNAQLNQAAECNVAGSVIVNPETRMATITVEVYYTGNSSQSTNYLTVAMVQDSILGAQSDYGNYNPGGWLNGQYVHQHALRDIITDNIWGDAITPTTQGTLITRTYSYAIPESIGSPNGVAVDLDNIHFLAFVTEQFQGTPTRPMLNACQLDLMQGVDEPIYPIVTGVRPIGGATCSHTKDIEVSVQNIGTETLTSMTVELEFEGETQTINWEGELPQYAVEKLGATIDVPFGTYPIHVTIVEANGETLNKEGSGSVECIEWAEVETEEEEVTLRLELMQDKFGVQTTWEFVASDGTVIVSGGPYTTLAGGATATQLHLESVTVPADECVRFNIYDSQSNGICCSYGHGYYIVKDSQGNVLFGDEDDGNFEESASHLISVRGPQATVEVGGTEVSNVSYTHADFVAPLTYADYPDEVGFECRKVTSPTPIIIQGHLNEFGKILGVTDELEHTSIYVVKAYAIVNGETYYGAETTFQTWTEGVAELEESLKIYPNPTTGVLNVQGEGMTNVEVFNAVGQRVMSQVVDGNGIQLNTESLNNGIYFLRIHANDGAVLNRTFSVAR